MNCVEKSDLIIECPICSYANQLQLGKRIYNSSDSHWESGLPKIQKYIFFNIWHNNEMTIDAQRCICKKCGFITDLPRPNEGDLDNKYKYLAKDEIRIGLKRDMSE